MGNRLMGEVSRILAELARNGEIISYYKFEERMQALKVVGDHVIFKTDKTIILEEKMTNNVNNKMGWQNILNKPEQMHYNQIFKNNPKHFYLFGFYPFRKQQTFVAVEDIMKINPKHKSYIEPKDFDGISVLNNDLLTTVKSIL